MVAQFGQGPFIARSSRLLPGGSSRPFLSIGSMPASHHEYRPRQGLGVTLHLGGKLAHLGWMRKPPMPVGHNANRQRHQGNPVELSPPVFAEEIACAAVLIVVLQGNE